MQSQKQSSITIKTAMAIFRDVYVETLGWQKQACRCKKGTGQKKKSYYFIRKSSIDTRGNIDK